jgi:hypothetical protein
MPSYSHRILTPRAGPSVLVLSTVPDYVRIRVRVNSSVRRAGRDRVRVSNQDVVETGYAPSS